MIKNNLALTRLLNYRLGGGIDLSACRNITSTFKL